MKNFKKILYLVLILGIVFSVPNLSLAIESKINSEFLSYQEFMKAQENGNIAKDITYEQLQELAFQSLQLEKEIENDGLFKKIYDSKDSSIDFMSVGLESGDIIMTNDTNKNGFTGHVGIAIAPNDILDIPGFDRPVRTQSPSQFTSDYSDGWVKVYRPLNSTWGYKAGRWARNTYKDSDAIYSLTNDLTTTHETYCSKIVYQAYKYGVGKDAFYSNYYSERLILPYELRDILKVEYHGSL